MQSSEEPLASNPQPAWSPGWFAKSFAGLAGVILPVIAIIIEMATKVCAETFFDPLPTWGHVLLVWVVPLVNGYVLWCAYNDKIPSWTLVKTANASVIGIALFYSIAYAPLTPLGIIAIIFFGLGLLPLAPIGALISAFMMRRWLRRWQPQEATGWARRFWPGVALAFVALLIAEAPGLVTRVTARRAVSADAAQRDNGIALIRRWGSEDWLLRACYDRSGRADMFGFLFGWQEPLTTEEAQQIYYAVTGRTADSVPPPRFLDDRFDFDERRDFTQSAAGPVIKGLTLNASQIDGSLDGDAALGYLEWTMVFKNANQRQEEARAHIQLPAGAVVSRLTLWINGEEREAAFAGRGQVTQAYEQVVRRRMDPVLVTTAGPDRVQMRCFPVPPGGEMKIRIGITTPLRAQLRTLRLPYFVERNFSTQQVVHNVWLESKQGLESVAMTSKAVKDRELLVRTELAKGNDAPPDVLGKGVIRPVLAKDIWLNEKSASDTFSLRGTLSDKELEGVEGTIVTSSNYFNIGAWAEDKKGAKSGRVIELSRDGIRGDFRENISFLVLVVDTSGAMREKWPATIKAIEGITRPKSMTLLLPGGNGANDYLAIPHSFVGASKEISARLQQAKCVGGADNVAALEAAWDIAAQQPNSAIVWLHGPQPVLTKPLEGLRQRWERRPDGPRLYAAQVVNGPDRLTAALDGVNECQSLSLLNLETDFQRALFDRVLGEGLASIRNRDGQTGPPAGDFVKTSDHLARLWAADEIKRWLATNQPADRENALKLAVEYQIVTPVSGAVVLETKEQYDQNGLKPVDANTVPTIPEPETVLLIVVALALLFGAAWRYR